MTETKPATDDEIERAAIKICWLGFALPEAMNTTPARYWKRITEPNREFYRGIAKVALSIVSKRKPKP